MSGPTLLRLAVVAVVLSGCGESGTTVASGVVVEPASTVVAGVGGTVDFVAVVRGASGLLVGGAEVRWSSADPAVAVVDVSGTATGVAAGVTTISATSGDATGSARLEVYVAPESSYPAGVPYFGREGYIEYVPGELPVVISVPHGGALTPEEIPDRSYGTLVTDGATIEVASELRAALLARTGSEPHLVVSHLRRTKLDPNREIEEAAQGNPFAEHAWREFHGFVERARADVDGRYGRGMYFDLHGHGHDVPRVELGYLLSAAELNRADARLDALEVVARSSVRDLGRTSPLPFSMLLRGPTSFGGMLARVGVRSVPSPSEPSPGSDEYFSGGYSTRRHGSVSDGETISGVQIELHRPGARDSEANRRALAAALAEAIESFMLEHYGYFAPRAGG